MSEPQDQPELVPPMTDEQLGAALEALLLMAEEPMDAGTLAEATRVPVERVTAALAVLARFYDETGRGFELRHIAGGWRYYTRGEHAGLISRWLVGGQQARLSQAALETLAVVAYLQPISRTRVAAVRGVSVDGVMRTLVARGLIEEAGQDEETGAVVFRTTEYFLERMGLTGLAELPPLAPYLPDATDLESELGRLATEPATGDSASETGATETGATETGTSETSTIETSTSETMTTTDSSTATNEEHE